jgi:cyclopropane fatty-acyl-phospholipid synthase-like methyltransferase
VSEEFKAVTEGYDRIGDRYWKWSHASPVRLHWLNWLLATLLPDKVVVDLGCGPGDPATRMLAQRHRVIGVDGSMVQLQLAKRSAPSARLVRADMSRFALRPSSVDAVVSFYALGHIPARRHTPLFATIAEWLRPGGFLLASAPCVAGDGTEDDWLGVPMFFGGIGDTATRQSIEQSGMTIENWQVIEEDEGDGHIVRFLWLVARKPQVKG